MPDVRVLCATRSRGPHRLDLPRGLGSEPSVAAIRAVGVDGSAWLAGGEPTLREDLPALVRATAGWAPLGLITDGLALTDAGVARGLHDLGLRRVRIGLHAARAEAHDWLVGLPGASKRVLRAIRACASVDLHVDVEVIVTRPTAALLVETVEVAARLGARGVTLRRIAAVGPAADDFVALSPRFGLLEPHLEAAATAAARAGLQVRVVGFPACAMPRVVEWRAEPEPWLLPEGSVAPEEARMGPGCAGCPGGAECSGAPEDYVARFGWNELGARSWAVPSAGGMPAGSPEQPTNALSPMSVGPVGPTRAASSSTQVAGTARGLGAVPPPERGERRPATRVRAAILQSQRQLRGDPQAGTAPGIVPEVVRIAWGAPSGIACATCGDVHVTEVEPTRDIRVRLVRAAQIGARVLRVSGPGTTAHPRAAELLRECTRLSFPEIEVAGEASALAAFSDAELRRLRGITRFDGAFFGADAATHDAHTGKAGSFDAALTGLRRLEAVAGVRTGAYAVLHGPESVEAFAAAWAGGLLPGAPRFRLSPEGGSLHDLVAIASASSSPAREALLAVLPRCMAAADVDPAASATVAFADPGDLAAYPSASDVLGVYLPCCGAARPGDVRCPGRAVGWIG